MSDNLRDAVDEYQATRTYLIEVCQTRFPYGSVVRRGDKDFIWGISRGINPFNPTCIMVLYENGNI